MAIQELSYPNGLLNPYKDVQGRELFAASRFDIDRDMVTSLKTGEYPQTQPFLEGRMHTYVLNIKPEGTAQWIVKSNNNKATIIEYKGSDAAYNTGDTVIELSENNPFFVLERETAGGNYILQNVFRWIPGESPQ